MSWHGKKMDPEKVHGKEEWERMQKQYLEQRYNGCVSEIEYILDSAFKLPEIFEPPQNLESGELIQQPNFLSTNKNLVELLSSDSLYDEAALLKGLSKADLLTEKLNLENQLKLIGEGCNKVFKAVAEVLRQYIKSEFDRILNSNKSKKVKIDDFDALIDQSNDLVAFFGVRYPENKANSGGLIYGTDIKNCLLSINHIGAVESILESNFIPQFNHFSSDQTDVNLGSLQKLQDIALPKAQEFIKVQIALNNYSLDDQVHVGRPETYPKEKTLQWYNEYKSKREFQHKNGMPFKTKIKEKIIELHTHIDSETGQELKPTIDSINQQFRKLGLTKS